jgi:hypothetical protein
VPCGITALGSPRVAMATTLMLFFDVDFQDTLEASSSEASSAWVATVVGLYFFLFHILGVMVFLNVINAIIITFYSNAMADRDVAEKRDETLEEIRQHILTKLEDQKVDLLSSIAENPKFDIAARHFAAVRSQVAEIDRVVKGLRVSKGSTLDSVSLMRKLIIMEAYGVDPKSGFFTNHRRVSLDELMGCQKHAKGIDLKAAFFEKNHGARAWKEVEHRFRMNLLRLQKKASKKKGQKKEEKKSSKKKTEKGGSTSNKPEKDKSKVASEKELGRRVVFRDAGDLVLQNGATVTEVALVVRGGLKINPSRDEGEDEPSRRLRRGPSISSSLPGKRKKWRPGEIVGELAFLTRSANAGGDVVTDVGDTEIIFVNLEEFLQMDQVVLSGFAEHIARAHVEECSSSS